MEIFIVFRPTPESTMRIKADGLMTAHRRAAILGGWVETRGGAILEDPRAINERGQALMGRPGRVSQSLGLEADNEEARK